MNLVFPLLYEGSSSCYLFVRLRLHKFDASYGSVEVELVLPLAICIMQKAKVSALDHMENVIVREVDFTDLFK